MTDITELAQSLKALANNAGADNWQAKKISGDFYVIRKGSYKRECGYTTYQPIAEIDHKPTRDYVAMANPANILALVEALEKAQAENTTGVAGMAESYETTISMLRSRIAELESRTVTAAAADVLAERQRQVTAEGWSPKHDDQYKNTELAFAASCYAFHAAAASWDLEDNGIPYDSHPVPKQWPWDPSWWRPTDARRDLVKAGALILAEIERLDRAAGIKVETE